MSEIDWKFFYLCMVELVIFVGSGFAALHYRGLWINLKRKYEFPENQSRCLGYAGGCDGDLEGTKHEEFCPARGEDLKLRPHLYVQDDIRLRSEPVGKETK